MLTLPNYEKSVNLETVVNSNNCCNISIFLLNKLNLLRNFFKGGTIQGRKLYEEILMGSFVEYILPLDFSHHLNIFFYFIMTRETQKSKTL